LRSLIHRQQPGEEVRGNPELFAGQIGAMLAEDLKITDLV